MIRFAAAVFVSAALLFMVQPMAAKRALPVLGGSPGVWTASMLFFQVALLAGYGYAHALSKLALRRQIAVHAATLLLPLAALAWLPSPAPPGPSASPILWLLLQLASTVGLPFFALSTTASLLQRWFSLGDARDPYPLYAASNLGSLAGLFAYPLLVEPFLALDRQRALWTAGYALFVALASVCAGKAWRAELPGSSVPAEPAGWRDRLRWIVLAAAPTSLLLGVTQHLSTDLTPFPLLWVLPLAFYLLSYVVAFSPKPAIPRRWALALQPLFLLPLALLMPWEVDINNLLFPLVLPLHLLAFFFTATVCHGELADRRPPAAGLTEFYLCLAVGGAIGGVFNALLAPLLFTIPIEYPLLLVTSCLLRPSPGSRPITAWRAASFPIACGAISLLILLMRYLRGQEASDLLFGSVAVASGLALLPLLIGRPSRLALGMGALLLVGGSAKTRDVEILHRDRSFFGAHHVERVNARRSLVHGRILHGSQDEEGAWRTLPLTYYHRQGPCGWIFEALWDRIPNGRVAAVGLGAGTVAAYGKPGNRWTFFEIDPAVERTSKRWFSYLDDSEAETEVVIADGRIGLERSSPGEFGLIVLDAFSSDAVPTHLLTREALELYFSRLAKDGWLALHVSNRFLDLVRLLAGQAARGGWAGLVADDQSSDETGGGSHSTWVVLARRVEDMKPLSIYDEFVPLPKGPYGPAWTDAHSSILPYIRVR